MKVLEIDGYVLIGGKSSRMGTDKFALRLGGITFAELAVAALKKIACSVYFVAAASQQNENTDFLPPGAEQIIDIFPDKAALGGIYTALSHSNKAWIAVLACDYPFVTGDLFKRLTKAAELVSPEVSAIAPLQPDGRVQPFCALYRVADCLPIAARLLKTDKIPPARKLLEEASAQIVDFEQLKDLPGANDFFTNINTPTDFLSIQN